MEVVYTGSLKKQNKKNEKTLASVFCIVCTGLEISELGFKKTKQGKKKILCKASFTDNMPGTCFDNQ